MSLMIIMITSNDDDNDNHRKPLKALPLGHSCKKSLPRKLRTTFAVVCQEVIHRDLENGDCVTSLGFLIVTHPTLLAVFSTLAEVSGPPGRPESDPEPDDEDDRHADTKEHPHHSFSWQLLTNLKHHRLTKIFHYWVFPPVWRCRQSPPSSAGKKPWWRFSRCLLSLYLSLKSNLQQISLSPDSPEIMKS